MEDWTAASDEPKKLCPDRIRDCDLCVLLVGFRRGRRPEGEALSITQMEYQAAVDLGIDVLVFMLDENSPWPRKFDELDKDAAIRQWRAELAERRGVSYFGLEPTSIEIAPALTRWIAHKQQAAPSRVVARPSRTPWSSKTVRIGIQCGLLAQVDGRIEFTKQVAESLRLNGRNWILGKPLPGGSRVLADWTEYSTMSIVAATKPGTVLAEDLQRHLYVECQHQLVDCLLELAVEAGVMRDEKGTLAVADDLSDETMENFRHLDSLGGLEDARGDPRTAAVLAFADMVRTRLILHVPGKSDYAEALATLILSQFGFWKGPELDMGRARPLAARRSRSQQSQRLQPKTAPEKAVPRKSGRIRGAGSTKSVVTK